MSRVGVGPATVAGYAAAVGSFATAAAEGLSTSTGKWLYIVAAALAAITNAGRQWQAAAAARSSAPELGEVPESARTPDGAAPGGEPV